MTTPQIVAAAVAVGVLGLLTLAAFRLSVWIDRRRQVSRTVQVAASWRDVADVARPTADGQPGHISLTLATEMGTFDRAALDDPTDEIPLAVDPPTDRFYLVPAPKRQLHRPCVEAYADRRYPDICKTCRPIMGAHR